MDTRLSIVIPTYQRCSDVVRAIRSIEQPGCEDVEVIVSDNASTDGTAGAIESLSMPFQVRYHRQSRNVGMLHNFYDVSRQATSEFQLWLSDDDYLFDSAIATLLSALDEFPTSDYFLSPVVPIENDSDTTLARMGPFQQTTVLEPGIDTASDYMQYGWVYSRQVFRTACIDWNFWKRHVLNAYTPILMCGRALLHHQSTYLKDDIVAHTVMNEKYWEEFGDSERSVMLRTARDRRDAMAAVLDDHPDRRQAARHIARWQRRCDEDFLTRSRTFYDGLPSSECRRDLREHYGVSPARATIMALRTKYTSVNRLCGSAQRRIHRDEKLIKSAA